MTIKLNYKNLVNQSFNNTMAAGNSYFDNTQSFGFADPSDMTEVKCFMIFVGGPEEELKSGTCYRPVVSSNFKFGNFAGFISAGQEAEIEVPAGNDREIFILGTNLAPGNTCEDAFKTNPTADMYSQPFFLGSKVTNLTPGFQTVAIDIDLQDKVGACSGPGLPNYSPAVGGVNQITWDMSDPSTYPLIATNLEYIGGGISFKTLGIGIVDNTGANGSSNSNVTFTSHSDSYKMVLNAINGYYESPIFDAGKDIDWSQFNFTFQPGYPVFKPFVIGEMGYGHTDTLSNNLIGYWPFDTDASDSSASANNGTISFGSPTFSTAGKFGNQVTFDGAGDEITLPATVASTQNFSIAFWLYYAGSFGGGYDTIFDKLGASTGFKVMVNGNNSGSIRVLYQDGSSNLTLEHAGPSASTWHHVTVTSNDSVGVKVFIDGGNPISQANILAADTSNLLALGDGSGSNDFDGSIDELLIYDRTLAANEVSQLYQRGAGALSVQLKHCDDAACSGETFITPSMNEVNSTQVNPLVFDLFAKYGVSFNNRYFQYRADLASPDVSVGTPPEIQQFAMTGPNPDVYYAARQSVIWDTGLTTYSKINHIVIDADTTGSGDILEFQVSIDGGTTWLYYDGTGWVTPSGSEEGMDWTDSSNTSYFASLPAPTGEFKVKFLFEGDGTSTSKINDITLHYE